MNHPATFLKLQKLQANRQRVLPIWRMGRYVLHAQCKLTGHADWTLTGHCIYAERSSPMLYPHKSRSTDYPLGDVREVRLPAITSTLTSLLPTDHSIAIAVQSFDHIRVIGRMVPLACWWNWIQDLIRRLGGRGPGLMSAHRWSGALLCRQRQYSDSVTWSSWLAVGLQHPAGRKIQYNYTWSTGLLINTYIYIYMYGRIAFRIVFWKVRYAQAKEYFYTPFLCTNGCKITMGGLHDD